MKRLISVRNDEVTAWALKISHEMLVGIFHEFFSGATCTLKIVELSSKVGLPQLNEFLFFLFARLSDRLCLTQCLHVGKLRAWIFRLRNDLYCVGWGVKLYSLTHEHDLCAASVCKVEDTDMYCCHSISQLIGFLQLMFNTIQGIFLQEFNDDSTIMNYDLSISK